MKKRNTSNGYITLKVTLLETKISRTITVPGNMSLADLNRAIQSVMGWENYHLWHFMTSRRDGIFYELIRDQESCNSFFASGPSLDAEKTALSNVFYEKGSKLFYEYDFGDGWMHVVTRMADPKTPGIACVKAQGPDGIEDFGGSYLLDKFIERMSEKIKAGNDSDIGDSYWFKDIDKLKQYLSGRPLEEIDRSLKSVLSGVQKPTGQQTTLTDCDYDDETARLFAMLLIYSVDSDTWEIIEEAMQNKGTCKFDDPDDEITQHLLSEFPGIKIKRGRSNIFQRSPMTMTLPDSWVKWYEKYWDKYREMRAVFDTLEAYACSAANLYGTITFDELEAIIRRYDTGFHPDRIDWRQFLIERAKHNPDLVYRVENENILSSLVFPLDLEDPEIPISNICSERSRYDRWFPENRDELFLWENGPIHPHTPESTDLKLVLRSDCGARSDDQADDILTFIAELLQISPAPDIIRRTLASTGIIKKLSGGAKKSFDNAVASFRQTVRLYALNGHTLREAAEIDATKEAVPKISRNAPCPCGSGKKYKLCCGK